MDFIKRNLFIILCAVAAIVGIVLGVTGLQAMPKVVAEMKSAESVYNSLQGLESKPINERVIEAEQKRIDTVLEDRAKVLQKAEELYPGYIKSCTGEGVDRVCTPNSIVDDVFPEGSPVKRLDFRNAYRQAMNDLFTLINGGGPSTSVEQGLMQRKIEDEKVEFAKYGSTDQAAAADFTGETKNAAGALTRAGVRQDAKVRADIQAAQRIYCYVTPFIPAKERKAETQPSLEYEDSMEDTSSADAPTLEDVWRAQVGYWIQRDIIQAIADVNSAAVEENKAGGRDSWVGTLPVKDLISIRLGPDFYVPPEGSLYPLPEPGGYTSAVPAGTAETVFTKTASGPNYEVLQVSVKLVMDQRDILKLARRVSQGAGDKGSFYTLVRAAYKEVPPNLGLSGKIYGSEPAVNVILDFEFVMVGGIFRPWMPAEVCEKFAITCPERAAAEEEK